MSKGIIKSYDLYMWYEYLPPIDTMDIKKDLHHYDEVQFFSLFGYFIFDYNSIFLTTFVVVYPHICDHMHDLR